MKRLFVFFAVSGLAFGCATTEAPSTTPVVLQVVPDGKLPAGVTPLHYVLDLGIDANAGTTSSRVKIDVRLDAAQSEIWMHSREHVVSSVSVGGVSGTFKQVNEQGVAHVVLDKPVGPGDVELTIVFTGVVQNSLEGLYKVTQGKDNYAFTQFETTHARQAFPCFDEPRFKTSFDVTLTIPKAHDAAGNTPEVKREDVGAGLQKYTFARTKPMPTYLLAWAVGPLDIVEAKPIPANDVRKSPLPFRGIAVRGRGERLKYALEQTPKILKAQEEYMGSPYPYAKLDIVAVPDFGSGAMENIGLITFQETLLLLQPDAPTSQRQWFAYVMAHELAHMWFGNLVTMPWWDDVWLNEAFATWFEIKAANEVYPEYNADVASLAWIQRAMGQDSLVSARQIRQPIVSHHDIPSAFDSITYEKGAGVITMFENYVGKKAFRTALQNYMKKHAFGTATTEDFLAALSDATSPEIGKAFNTFLTQPGIPMLKLSLSCEGRCVDTSRRTIALLPTRVQR